MSMEDKAWLEQLSADVLRRRLAAARFRRQEALDMEDMYRAEVNRQLEAIYADELARRDCHECQWITEGTGEIHELDRLRELVEADRDRRCVVLPAR